MFALEFQFLSGRLHTTPWGRHVNEGAVEWPISSWRFLRALVATWHRKGQAMSEHELRQLVGKLGAENPVFYLPPASVGHTRHYMPLYRSPLDGKTSKIFDTFVALDKSARLVMAWPGVMLEPREIESLDILLSAMTYLGRAESWVDARRLEGWDGKINAGPAESGRVGENEEIVRLMCPMPEERYTVWADSYQQAAGAEMAGKNKKSKSTLPADVFSALHAETADLQSQGWSQPPGAEWVDYARSRDVFKIDYQPRRPHRPFPVVARFALSSNVKPLFTNAIGVAERLREALIKWSDGAPVFVGRDGDAPRQGGAHEHAFILPEDVDSDGFIDHITVYARQGFDRPAQIALSRIDKLWGAGGHDLFLALVGMGRVEDYRETCPVLGVSPIWESRTPYVPAGHLKLKARDRADPALLLLALKREVGRELARRSLPIPTGVAFAPPPELRGKRVAWLKFRNQRKAGGGQRGDNGTYGLRLTFSEPMSGPLALGYGAHFGLGLFVPAKK